MTMKKFFAIAIVAVFAGCMTASNSSMPMAQATLAPTTGQTAKGTVHFMDLKDGAVEVDVNLTGLTPGQHGFHVHDKGDCGDDAKNAGPHYNPMNEPHGGPSTAQHHAGDFGNVVADANGNVKTKFATRFITVAPGPKSVVGHAVVLHGGVDDLASQPAGNAGPRIACGVAETMTGEMH